MSSKLLSNTSSTLKTLKSKLKCFICDGLPENPQILWCKHSFCKECILKMESCPLCGFKVTPQDLVPDIMFQRLLRLMDAATNLCTRNPNENQTTSLSNKREDFKNCFKDATAATNSKESDTKVSKTRSRLKNCVLVSNESEKSGPKTLNVSNYSCVPQNTQIGPSKTPQSSKKEPHKVNVKGETPLQIVARQGKLSKVQDLLLKGANPNVKDYAGWTPLCDAVSSGKIEVVKALLEAGAGVNTPGHQNTTALVEAVVRKDKDMIKLLMSYGADMNQRTSLDNTALSIANEELTALLLSCNTYDIQQMPQIKTAPNTLLMSRVSKNNVRKVEEFCEVFNLAVSTVFTDESSHIVVECGEDKLCEESLELMQGLLKGCSVVGVDWVTACLAENELLPVDEFEPTAIHGQPGNKVFTRARLNQERLLPRLFDGCHMSLWHEQAWSTELRQEVKMLVKLGGAKFLPRACDAERIPLDEQTVMFHAPPPSPLAYTSHIVLYQPGVAEPQLKYNMEHIKTLPLDWFYRCISSFSILPPEF